MRSALPTWALCRRMTAMSSASTCRLLTEDRRKELAKDAHKFGEEAKVAVRNNRREGNDMVKKNKELTEDMKKDAQEKIQKMTDDHVKKIDAMVKEEIRRDHVSIMNNK